MYYIIEIQKYLDGSFGHIIHWAETRNLAESKYHEVLSYAAKSDLPQHAACIISDQGFPILNQCYMHDIVEESAPEPEYTPSEEEEVPSEEEEVPSEEEEEPSGE